MNSRLKHRLMAYVCMPLIFSILGYVVVLMAAPSNLITIAEAVLLLVGEETTTNQDTVLTNIFDENSYNNTAVSEVELPIQEQEGVMVEVYQYIDKSEVNRPNYGEMYGRLTCSAVDLDAGVFWGDSTKILRNGAGQYIGSFLPGYGKPILISGHNTTFFLPLQNISQGDTIVLQTNYEIYEYEVYRIEVIQESEAETLMEEYLSKSEEELILYTCYPFEKMTVRKTNRYFVFAKKVSGLPVDDKDNLSHSEYTQTYGGTSE